MEMRQAIEARAERLRPWGGFPTRSIHFVYLSTLGFGRTSCSDLSYAGPPLLVGYWAPSLKTFPLVISQIFLAFRREEFYFIGSIFSLGLLSELALALASLVSCVVSANPLYSCVAHPFAFQGTYAILLLTWRNRTSMH